MNARLLLKNSLLLAAGLFLSSAAANAATYQVTVNTASLIGNANGPFYIDFQLNGGDTPGNNTATISSFSFGGGSAADTPVLLGNATGSLSSVVTLGNNTMFTEFYQQFTPGNVLQFQINVTQNLDGVTPDLFAFSILDSSLFGIDTTDVADALVTFNIDSAGNLSVNTAQGTGSYSGVTVNAVPEPSAALLSVLGAGLMMRRRRKG